MARQGGLAPAVVLVLVFSLLLGVSGCGGGDSKGANVNVYVGASLCAGAKRELGTQRGQAGNFKVSAICLPATEVAAGGGQAEARTNLATAGANARRATEDTSAVALLEPPGNANKFAAPILESAGIPLVTSPSGQTAMARTLKAIDEGGSSSIRNSVRETLEPS